MAPVTASATRPVAAKPAVRSATRRTMFALGGAAALMLATRPVARADVFENTTNNAKPGVSCVGCTPQQRKKLSMQRKEALREKYSGRQFVGKEEDALVPPTE
ncbi:unnamed protein product [Pedinophyceae sp. YPF-701]|nr:unnamed protein product [Pedinophyceae sp. YPF-701]